MFYLQWHPLAIAALWRLGLMLQNKS